MIDYLSLAGDLIERTSSTLRVQNIVQLSLAPVFLLAAIGAVLNVMNARLSWLTDRIEFVERRTDKGLGGREGEEMPALRQRQQYAQWAVNLVTSGALTICLVIAALFISAFIRPQIGTFVAVAWVVTMAQLVAALVLFLLETRLATASARERRRRSRAILERRGEMARIDDDLDDTAL
ncbi:DUF2721 domain-containing protein [Aurantiacibacter spongiae]|uniref:DUF2721 domain-containing protein n=1 Tax=Aurantiacibacter spongiae TaxID=2488860 RepID=A0A3N5CWU5_9SPHN|nr:DUF2721 domain-containing protein [Aurantiacibacter spongiae]RPF72806.1 DUF2721 domain-containing protein [Aurantiacibacter spongiae]